jgi:DNA-binding transcriptional regulator YiaG
MRKTKSPILEAVRDTAKGLHKAGVMDQVTLREFDPLCLPPVERCSLSKSSTSAKPRGSARPSLPVC